MLKFVFPLKKTSNTFIFLYLYRIFAPKIKSIYYEFN